MSEIKNFVEAHARLSEYIPTSHRPKYSLDVMKQLMARLDNPQEQFKTIHVAGTSGKTSTCYYLAALFQSAGKKVGLTVSPHVDEINERVQINLEPLEESVYCRELSEFLDIIKKTGLNPTYFEVLVAFAYWYFAKQKVDYAVIEVGLGGLLDGTNVIEREDKVAVITDIGLDHTEVLGKTLPDIAAQKAGIIKSRNAVFSYKQGGGVSEVIRGAAVQQHADYHEVDFIDEQIPKDVPPFKQRNWYLAKSVYDYVAMRDHLSSLDEDTLTESVHIRIPARMEEVTFKGKTIIVDGSHNDQKIKTLLEGIRYKYPKQKIAGLISFGENKTDTIRTSLKLLTKELDFLVITEFKLGQDEPRHAIKATEIASICKELGFNEEVVVVDPVEAFNSLMNRPEQLLLVTGSFYLLNYIRPLIFKT